jgi:hypothetical protein
MSAEATKSVPIYRAIVQQFERRRRALGLAMWKVDEAAGGTSRYYAHMLYPDTPNGRQSTWEIVQLYADALFPDGFVVKIEPGRPGSLLPSKHRVAIKYMGVRYDIETRQDWMKELSQKGASKGGIARAKKLSARRRKQIAKRAAKKRWRTPRIVEITKGEDNEKDRIRPRQH